MMFAHTLGRCLAFIPKLHDYQIPSLMHQARRIASRIGLVRGQRGRWDRDSALIALNPSVSLQPLSRAYDETSLNIHWVIPDFIKGAGGHQTIFRIIKFLETFGHRQTIWIQNPMNGASPSSRLDDIRAWYQPLHNVHLQFLPDDVSSMSGDVVIATDCWTAYPVRAMSRFKERFYFIQDFEPFFHPMGELYLTAENTYRFGFAALCAGEWLRGKAESYGMWARSWDLSNDPAVYSEGSFPRVEKDRLRIAFYARAVTPRRAVALGLAGFEELARRGHDFEVILFGQQGLDLSSFSFEADNRGILSPEELAQLYAECDIGVVFSVTNYSLIPLEMMGCGLPVVEIDGEPTRTAFPEGTVVFAPPDPIRIADTLEALMKNPAKRAALREEGRAFVSRFSWQQAAKAIEVALLERLEMSGCRPFRSEDLFKPALLGERPRATVVIPTYNAGGEFRAVLDILTRQVTPWRYDVLVIDSGSSDGTAEFAESYENVAVHRIPNSEFQHGRTRNLGVELSAGEFVAFLTQDAQPRDEKWLQALIAGFEMGPRVAGVFGRHVARAEHDAFVKRDIEAHFDHFAALPRLFEWGMKLPREISPGSLDWKLLLAFYSDNNSALRKSVWSHLPYPNIDWGEDQVWAWQIIEAGLQKAYVNDAVVIHSHAYEAESAQKVAEQEGAMFQTYFGHRFARDEGDAVRQIRNRVAQDALYAARHGVSARELDERKAFIRQQVLGRNPHLFGGRPQT